MPECRINIIRFLDGVKKFLELGANPNLPNTMKTAVSSIKVTPLGIAVAKGYPAIAEEILKYKPSSEVIQGAFALCHLSCKDILIEACNREAIVAFKAKQYNKAKDLYLKALEHMQESLSYSVRYNLGVCLLEKGEEKNALEVFSDLKMKLTSAKINAALLAKVETRITQLTNDSAPICRTPR